MTYVCQHLVRGSGLGFFYGDSKDLRPDAWCGDCDRILIENGGEWNDESEAFAKVTILCANCYDIVRQRNEVAYKRIKPPSTPNLEEDSWELDSALRRHELHPDTFEIPLKQELAELRVGDLVKLLFLFPGKDESGTDAVRCERMWVTIEQISDSDYVGRLESQPTLSNVLKLRDTIRFERRHIASISTLRDDLHHPDSKN